MDGVWVLGCTERTEKKRIVLVAVDNRTKETLNTKIVAKVSKDSTIYTDCWKGYADIKNKFEKHSTVNHSIEFVKTNNQTHTIQ